MKELHPHHTDTVQNIQPAQHAKKEKLVHRMFPQKGQTLFEYDVLGQKLRKATYEDTPTISYLKAAQGEMAPHRKVLLKENHIYIAALNFKNAIKQVRKIYPHANPEIIKDDKF